MKVLDCSTILKHKMVDQGMLRHVNRVHEMCTEILGRTGGTFLLKGPWFANMDMLGTLDPVKVHHVMSSNFPNFPKEPELLKMFDVLGDGIFNSDADLWKNQRKLAHVLISHQRFYQFLVKTSLGKVETGLIPVLNHVSEQGLIADLQDLFQRFTFDTTYVPFAKALLMRHVVLETVWRIQSWLGIGHEKKLSEAWKTLDRVINKYVSMKKEEMSKKDELKEGEEAVDLLTSYLIEDDTFNQGPRTCLGKEVAFTQMKAVSAAIIHNYNVRVVEGHPVVPNASIILYMKHGLKVRVANRWI
ncbi:unnamed protein product [Camellia sinensis]